VIVRGKTRFLDSEEFVMFSAPPLPITRRVISGMATVCTCMVVPPLPPPRYRLIVLIFGVVRDRSLTNTNRIPPDGTQKQNDHFIVKALTVLN
jgi:hypothetical protein